MSIVVDNMLAYRFLSMLVKPFEETDAYKAGIIDASGNNLIKIKDLNTPEQRSAYTYLHRLVFNIKKLINKTPGGESKLKNIVAAFFLFKEAYESRQIAVNENKYEDILKILNDGVILAEEQLVIEDFLLAEDAPVNATGAAVSTNQPVIKKPRKFAKFIVNDEVYNKFSAGKAKYRKWSDYLNLENEGEKMIYDFAKKNHRGVIILQNGTNERAIRFNRNGGGKWHKITRK